MQKISAKARRELGQVLGRPVVDEKVVAQMIEEHTASLPPDQPYGYNDSPNSSQGQGLRRSFSQGSYHDTPYQRASGSGPAPVPANAGFTSALTTYKTTPVLPAYVPEPTPPVAVARVAAASASQAKNQLPKDQPRLSFGQRPLATTDRILGFSQMAAGAAGGASKTFVATPATSSKLVQFNSATAVKQPAASGSGSKMMPSADRTLASSQIGSQLLGATPSSAPRAAAFSASATRPTASGSFSTGLRALPSTDRILAFSQMGARVLAASSSQVGGSLNLPETRASIVDAPVLLNPVAPLLNPPSLVAGFQEKEALALSNLESAGLGLEGGAVTKGKGKGKAKPPPKPKGRPSKASVAKGEVLKENIIVADAVVAVADVVMAEPAVPAAGGRPQRGAAKRCLEGFETLGLKKGRRST